MGVAVKHVRCPECAREGRDSKGDNLAVYEDGSVYCFACGYRTLSEEYKSNIDFIWTDEYEAQMSKEVLTKEDIAKIKSVTGEDGKGSRGITNETYSSYLVRFEYDQESGDITKHLYPITLGYKAVAYKIRRLPKDFSPPHYGHFNADSDFFGQWKFKNSHSKVVVITAGEVDCLSAFQILENYRKRKGGDFEPTPVISSIIGENGTATQAKKHYEWLNRFEKIVVCLDQDEAGRKAVADLSKALPKGKMFVMELSMKDTNAMLEAGKESDWLTAYYKARPFTPDGIVASSSLSDRIRELASIEKIPLPPFMKRLQEMMAGGIPLGRIVNIGSFSGAGKSTLIDEMVYYWIFNSPHRIGVVTLESEGGEYGTKVLSRHLGRKIDLIESAKDKLNFLNSEDTMKKEKELFEDENGSPRFHIVEDRDGGIESMKNLISNLVSTCEVKVIIIDPLQDVLDGMSVDDQAMFMRWMKGWVKSHGVTFVNINHVRKNSNTQKANSAGADLYEEDFQGSSSIFKSGACNILFTRNKEAEDEIERNTTYMKMTKCRWTGRTGFVSKFYYDNATHTLYDFDDYVNMTNPNQVEF